MEIRTMRAVNQILLTVLFCAIVAGRLEAGTYSLTDGQTVSGDPISYNDAGVILKSSDGTLQPRVAWGRFSQPALKQLVSDAKNPADAKLIEPFLEETAKEQEKRSRIEIKPVTRPSRPTGRTGLLMLFTSGLGFTILLVLYAANIYAGYEVAIFRNRPCRVVCGAAAVLPFFGPLIFLFLPPPRPVEGVTPAAAPAEVGQNVPEAGTVADLASPLQPAGMPPPPLNAGAIPPRMSHLVTAPRQEKKPVPSVTFHRGDFTFNRRFFETKLAGFLRAVPGETEKNNVVRIRAMRGDFTGRRITNLTQKDLSLQVFHGGITADETIPFEEIQEVEIRPEEPNA